MNELYRGHEIVMLDGNPRSAIIIETESGAPLPTKVTAMPDEGDRSCRLRARRLIDLYLEIPSRA